MRILIVTTDFLPNVSGIATLSYEQASGLQEMGHTVRVLTTTPGATKAATETRLDLLEAENKQPPIVRLRGFYNILKNAVKDWKPDFIWCTNYRGFGLPLMAIARSQRVPYGIYLHGTELVTENRNVLRRLIFKTVLKHSIIRCTNSKNTAAILTSLYGLSAVPVTPGVHSFPKETAESANRSIALRKSWLKTKPSNCSDNERVVFIALCRISRQKGIHIVLESMAMLEPTLRDRVLFIAIGTGEAALELEQLAARLLVSDRVIFAGTANRVEVPVFLKAADVYLQPSQPVGDFLESFGISFLEAQAAGLPCIGTNWGGIPESVQGLTTGLLVPTESTTAVAEAMKRAIVDQQWRENAQIAGPDWALENTWGKHVKTIEFLLPV